MRPVLLSVFMCLLALTGCGDSSPTGSSSTTATSTNVGSEPEPTPTGFVRVTNVRRGDSSISYWRVNGTITNKTGITINRLSEVRIDVFNESGSLIHEDKDLLDENVRNEGQKTFSIIIPKRDVVQANYYTLEVTNYIDFQDIVQQCRGCDRREW